MNDLKVFSTDVIPVYTTDTNEEVVKGRELHDALGIGKHYTTWLQDMAAYGFEEEEDFFPISGESTGGRPSTDHILKFDMAKHICMIQRTEVGKRIRQKLIDLEKEVTSGKLLTGPELMAAALLEADKTIKSHELRIAEMRPKEIFADAVCASPSTILVGELAKVMSQNGFKIGANRLFERLRQDGFLIRGNRSDRNLPTQKSMDMGLFEIKETAITHSDGHVTTNKTPKVTGKGQVYFVNRYCRMELSA